MSTQGQGDVVERLRAAAREIRNDGTASQVGLSEQECEDIADEITRLRALLSSSRGEQGWRTMDSAPKDGEFVHLFGEHSRHGGVAQIVCRWDGAEWISSDDGYPAYIRPTHWRPLPSAPGTVPTSLAGQGTDGYVLVPDHPNEEMLKAARNADINKPPHPLLYSDFSAIYCAMLAAAPQPTAGGDAENG